MYLSLFLYFLELITTTTLLHQEKRILLFITADITQVVVHVIQYIFHR